MSWGGCRDCTRCTEVAIVSLIYLPFRAMWGFLTFWNIGLFQRKCPQCGHKMSGHRMVGGRFQD